MKRSPCLVVLVVAFAVASPAFAQNSEKNQKPDKKKSAKKKHDSKRWEKAIAAFERQDKQSPPPKNALLFVGSSSIRLWKLDKSFPDRKTINRGFGGSQIADSVHYVDKLVLKHKPRIVVLYAGDNDVAAGKSPQQAAADFAKFTRAVHAALPKSQILFIAIKPSVKRWNLVDRMKQANALIAAQCAKDDRLKYVDVFGPMLGDDGKPRPELFVKDGLHLNDEGYKLWASILRPHLVDGK